MGLEKVYISHLVSKKKKKKETLKKSFVEIVFKERYGFIELLSCIG